MMPRFLDLVDIDFFLVALRYTLMEQETLEIELPRCAERGVGIVIGGVFNSGILATGAVPGAKYNYADATPEALDKVAPHRGGVPAPQGAARRRRAAVPARPPVGRVGHPRRLPAGADRRPMSAISATRSRPTCGPSSRPRSCCAPMRRRRDVGCIRRSSCFDRLMHRQDHAATGLRPHA